jgi:hypothetical protein
MMKRLLNNPWFYFALSLIHQIIVFLPGEIPQLFPDSGSYFSANPQRTPIYPWILSTLNNNQLTACVQIFMFALAAAAFHVICRMVIERISLPKFKEEFIWIGSLYFATNFELIQFSPTILTESFGISFFVLYFFSILKWQRDSSKVYYVLSCFNLPGLALFTAPEFYLGAGGDFVFLCAEVSF